MITTHVEEDVFRHAHVYILTAFAHSKWSAEVRPLSSAFAAASIVSVNGMRYAHLSATGNPASCRAGAAAAPMIVYVLSTMSVEDRLMMNVIVMVRTAIVDTKSIVA